MSTIQHIVFPEKADTSALYFKSDSLLTTSTESHDKAAIIQAGTKISLNTYFNSFYQQYYTRHTNISSAEWRLHIKGNLTIRQFRDTLDGEPVEISCTEVQSSRKDAAVKIPVPPGEGRVYLELEAASNALFFGGSLESESPASNIRLAIAITCYKRDDYVYRNVQKLLDCPSLQGKIEIYLVDNGHTLSDLAEADNVHVIPNPNSGGAGGFSRGMMEILRNSWATHILITDDDIKLPPESVYRTLTFFAHAQGKVAISGTMFDAEKPHMIQEAGARWACGFDVPGQSPLKLLSLKNGTYAQSKLGLNALLHDENPDYGAFWFFAFPIEIPQQHGLCQPFFVVGDDIDFGLKTTRQYGAHIVALPSVAVWHVPFYFKLQGLAPYFFHRNLLAVSALHDNFTALQIANRFLMEVAKSLYMFNYRQAHHICSGARDFLKGPAALSDSSVSYIADRHKKFLLKWKIGPTSQLVPSTSLPSELEPKRSVWRDVLRVVTLGGHLIPKPLLSKNPGQYVTHRVGQWRKAFGHDTILIQHRDLHTAWLQQLRYGPGLKLWGIAIKLYFQLLRQWPSLQKKWKDMGPRMSSPASWQQRFDAMDKK